jgi:hypothetical protein
MKSLFFTYNTTVDTAYIIRVGGNANSEGQAKRCSDSCDKVNQPWEYWEAYNGISGTIEPPSHHNSIMKMIKVTDHYLTRGEVAYHTSVYGLSA